MSGSCLLFLVLAMLATFFVREAVIGIRNWSDDGALIRSRCGNSQAAWLRRISIPLAVVLVPISIAGLVVCLS
ncbi:hypothetical protein [Ilumatobacter fluminis]|nr:hypothetical protein [Ilumatobacter fluminis]